MQIRPLLAALRACRDALDRVPADAPGIGNSRINRALRRADAALKPYERLTPMNAYLSDLYLNHDKSECERFEKGNFAGYDEAALRANAEGFAVMIGGLGHDVAPSELIADFYHRL